MNARQLTGFLHGLLESRPRQSTSFRVEGPDVAGRAFRDQSLRELTVVAHSSQSSRAAERLRVALIDGAARLQSDSCQLASHVELLPTPVDLAMHSVTFLAWTTRAMQMERSWVAAYLRRGRVTWELLASASTPVSLVDVVAAVSLDLVSRDLSADNSSLWSLLPVGAELPVPMWLDATLGADPLDVEFAVA